VIFLLAILPLVFCGKCPGVCQDTSTACSSGAYQAGLCPGGNNIQCCKMATPNCPTADGQCQDSSLSCDGTYETGMCPGGSNIACCNNSAPAPSANASCIKFADEQWSCATPSCSSHVCTGCGQPQYQCAEFVSRSLASAKLIPLDPLAPQAHFGAFRAHGKTYDLLWVSHKQGGPLGLDDYLHDSGWHSCGAADSCVKDCSALMVVGSEGSYSHAVLGIGKELCDAHNMARHHVSPSTYKINNVWNPPANIHEIVARQLAEQATLPKIDYSKIKYVKPNYKGA